MNWELVSEYTNHKPVASFTSSANGRTATFTNSSSDEDGDDLSYQWNFGDNETSTEANPVHKYAKGGVYTVTLTVDDGQETDEKTVQITVEEPECSPNVDALYFAGTANGWTHDAMTFDSKLCKWTIDLNLTGEGDSNGAQRFKVTSAPNWNGKVYGSQNGTTLCDNQSKCGDIQISQKGNYKLAVDDQNMTWSFTSNGTVYIAPTRDAMYYAGTTNKWTHQKMSYNSQTGDWEITLELTGAGDSNGAQRFKVTSSANWNGTVWGDAGGNSLCSNQASCGDVFIGETGTYVRKVNDKSLTWVLDAK